MRDSDWCTSSLIILNLKKNLSTSTFLQSAPFSYRKFGYKKRYNALKFHSAFPVEEETIRLEQGKDICLGVKFVQTMKSCTKVVIVFFVLCAINACLAEAKWLWLNEDVMDDLELEADDAPDQHFKNAKRKMSLRKDCKTCKTSNCYNDVCIE